jgi:hypothetical protein
MESDVAERFNVDETVVAQNTPAQVGYARIHRAWAALVVVFGLALTVVWACLLGYALFRLFDLVF